MRTDKALLLNPTETRSAGALNIFGDRVLIKLATEDSNGNYAIMEITTPPQAGPPLHRHEREDECFYILEGEYVFEVDGRVFNAGPGCCVFAPRGTAHTLQNVGATPGRTLVTVQPGGLDTFFVELDRATRGMREPGASVVVPIFQKYGLELLGPPLALRSVDAVTTGGV